MSNPVSEQWQLGVENVQQMSLKSSTEMQIKNKTNLQCVLCLYLLLIELIKLAQSVSFQVEKTVTKVNKQKLNLFI